MEFFSHKSEIIAVCHVFVTESSLKRLFHVTRVMSSEGEFSSASVQSCYTSPSVISSKILKSRHLHRVPNYDKFVNAQTTLWPL